MLRDLKSKIMGLSRLAILTIVLPVVISVIYYTFIASNVYVSYSKFVVRSPDKPAASGLGVILKTAGFSNASEEVYAAQSFITSRDALKALNVNDAYKKAYTDSSISLFDQFNTTGFFGSFENLYEYYIGKIGVEYDPATSISTLAVRAYSPAEAQKINLQLLQMAEATVNRLNVRGRQDLIQSSVAEVESAKQRAQQSAMALAFFRNTNSIVDPEKQAAVQLQMIAKLQDELIATYAQIAQVKTFTPRNPQLEVLNTKAKTLKRAIGEQTSEVAGGRNSLSSSAAQYQRLSLESQLADKQLASALTSLENAENEARRKQAYVERIVQPLAPDAPLEPRRIRGIITTIVLSLIAWAILSMLLAGVREHRD